MSSIGEFVTDACLTYATRNATYGDVWRRFSLAELSAAIRLKAARIDELLRLYTAEPSEKRREKLIDDLRDIIIYAAMLGVRVGLEAPEVVQSDA